MDKERNPTKIEFVLYGILMGVGGFIFLDMQHPFLAGGMWVLSLMFIFHPIKKRHAKVQER